MTMLSNSINNNKKKPVEAYSLTLKKCHLKLANYKNSQKFLNKQLGQNNTYM
jgi:hypothetical protein